MLLPDESRARRLLHNASWLFGGGTLASLCGFGQAIVLGRALGADGYGLLGLAMAFGNVVHELIDIRLWETVTRFVGQFHERGQDGHARASIKLAYLIDAVTGVVAFGVVLLLAPVVTAQVLDRPGAATPVTIYAFTLLLATVNQTSRALLRVFDRFRWLGFERGGGALFRLLAVLWVTARGGGLEQVLWAYVVVELIHGSTLLVLGLRVSGGALTKTGPDHFAILRPHLREFLSFTGHNAATVVLKSVVRQLDVLILAAFRGDRDIGYYRMAQNFTKLVQSLVDPVSYAVYPELVRLRAQEVRLAEITGFLRRSMKRVLAVILPLAAVVAVIAPALLGPAVGSEFLPAAPAIRIMLVGVAVSAALLWARPLALAYGRPAVSTMAAAAGAAVMLAGSALLVPVIGYLGSAVMFLATSLTIAGLTAWGALRAARAPGTTPVPPEPEAES